MLGLLRTCKHEILLVISVIPIPAVTMIIASSRTRESESSSAGRLESSISPKTILCLMFSFVSFLTFGSMPLIVWRIWVSISDVGSFLISKNIRGR